MRKGLTTASLLLLTFLVFPIFEVQGQSVQQVAIKDGEVLPLGNPHTWVNNCRLTMIGLPKLEILEGPPELSISLKETRFLPYRGQCSKEVPGVILMMSAKGISAVKESLLTYRLNYKTKDGDRQSSGTYRVRKFPAGDKPSQSAPDTQPSQPASGDPDAQPSPASSSGAPKAAQ